MQVAPRRATWPVVVVTEKDSGKEVEVPKGGMLYVSLKGNTWFVHKNDEKKLKLLNPSGNRGGLLMTRLRLEARAKGKVELELQKPSTDPKAVKSFKVTVQIK